MEYPKYRQSKDREWTLRETIQEYLRPAYLELSPMIDRHPLFFQRFFEAGAARGKDLMDETSLAAFYKKELAYALNRENAKGRILRLIENNSAEKDLIMQLCADHFASLVLLKLAGARYQTVLPEGSLEREKTIVRQALEHIFSRK